MHDILKQPTYLDYSEIYLELPRGLRNYMYCCCLEENSKTCQKWPWGFECRLMRLVQFPKFRIASCGTLKSGVLQHGRTDGNTILCTYVAVQWQRPIERSCTSDCSLVPSYILFACIFAHFFAIATFVQISSGNLWIRQSSPNNLYNVLRSTSTTNRK